jgi:hypothetical protein
MAQILLAREFARLPQPKNPETSPLGITHAPFSTDGDDIGLLSRPLGLTAGIRQRSLGEAIAAANAPRVISFFSWQTLEAKSEASTPARKKWSRPRLTGPGGVGQHACTRSRRASRTPTGLIALSRHDYFGGGAIRD